MKILVLCTGNSCRSQMAEGYLRHFANNKATIFSAGIETHGVNPKAIETMLADGINISQHTSNHVDEYTNIDFDLIITVCDHAKEACPLRITKGIKIHQNFTDPSKMVGDFLVIDEAFVATRDQIKLFCKKIINKYVI